MNNRYDVALLYKKHWQLLAWKGDEHTNGIYFDEQFGYLAERTYAVRIEHAEPSPPVFYVPGFDDLDDEVYIDFPFRNMTKKPNKYNYLFSGNRLSAADLPKMFEGEVLNKVELEVEPLKELLQSISKKRERDRAWLAICFTNSETSIRLIQKKNEAFKVVQKWVKESECINKRDMVYITINANNALHALNLFSLSSSVLFSKSHDRIIVTNEASIPKVEVVISLPKEQIQREIEHCS